MADDGKDVKKEEKEVEEKEEVEEKGDGEGSSAAKKKKKKKKKGKKQEATGPSWKDQIPDEDRPVVDEMKRRMKEDGLEIKKEILNNDVYLARFSRARDRKVDDCYEMLKACLVWREENKVDTIGEWWATQDKAKKLINYYPAQRYWGGKNGRPICLDHFTLTDPAIMFSVFQVEDFVHFHTWIMEGVLQDLHDASEKAGEPITDAVFMFNMGGLAWKHMGTTTVTVAKPTFQIDALYYPECVAAAFVVNAPRLFSVLYKLVSPFVDPKTLEKVQIHGTEWQEPTKEWAPQENLPSTWGGTSDVVWEHVGGSCVPGVAGGSEQTIALTVGAGEVADVEVDIGKENSQVSYEFTTVDYDIDFQVDFVPKGGKEGKKTTLADKKRVQSHQGDGVKGNLGDMKKGKAILKFDNHYSWTTAKTVNLKYSVSSPVTKEDIKNMKKQEKEGKGKEAK